MNVLTTLSKVKNKQRLYIGLPQELCFIIGLIEKHTNVSEQNIILCLMRITLNRTFSQLADDFDLSVSQASNIFFNKLPEIANVISPLVRV
ncbi:transposase family protein [Pseudomonas aeruginosa]|nr:transposase family protein [Pseudomonas aeruginosa]